MEGGGWRVEGGGWRVGRAEGRTRSRSRALACTRCVSSISSNQYTAFCWQRVGITWLPASRDPSVHQSTQTSLCPTQYTQTHRQTHRRSPRECTRSTRTCTVSLSACIHKPLAPATCPGVGACCSPSPVALPRATHHRRRQRQRPLWHQTRAENVAGRAAGRTQAPEGGWVSSGSGLPHQPDQPPRRWMRLGTRLGARSPVLGGRACPVAGRVGSDSGMPDQPGKPSRWWVNSGTRSTDGSPLRVVECSCEVRRFLSGKLPAQEVPFGHLGCAQLVMTTRERYGRGPLARGDQHTWCACDEGSSRDRR